MPWVHFSGRAERRACRSLDFLDCHWVVPFTMPNL